METEFERLELLYQRGVLKLASSRAARQIIDLIDNGEPAARELELLIMRDPGLAAEFLKVIGHQLPEVSSSSSNLIRSAIVKMGVRAVRNLTVALHLRSTLSEIDPDLGFNLERYGRWVLAVGILAAFVYRRHPDAANSAWPSGELISASEISCLGLGLMPLFAPSSFTRLARIASRNRESLSTAFEKAYGAMPQQLATSAISSWKLPHDYCEALTPFDRVDPGSSHYLAACSIAFAHKLAEEGGYGMETWPVEKRPGGLLSLEFSMSDEEQTALLQLLETHVDRAMDSWSVPSRPETKAA
ncbi:MAG: HDOD domain-containing protein [Armatimonadetes bacterium]|nr:HDOD domain-containing protein [Armatimonadota bacterium]NOG91999.1 HDOD domain-containing protein [Armatimonadota bacterium]